ncbi:MAG: VCBS repeat-containing protein, partial [Saprospiraceae bacterium]|nr:VCBS repeat-containing protein [Saprospiraceae bacterium]
MKPGFQSNYYRFLRRRFFLFVILFSVIQIHGQDYSGYECPVNVNGKKLLNPFTGGFSAPQFSTLDADQDGNEDLFVYDRVGNVPMLFLGNGDGGSDGYVFSRQLEDSWPVMCCWTLIRDFNRDGIGDIFTVPLSGGISGAELHQGYLDQGVLKFKRRRMGGEPGDEEIIWFNLGFNTINVTIPFNDKPEIKDVDGDGDLDILTFDLGGSFVNYYKNLQEENGLPKDTMVYELNDLCFGKFKESGFAETIFLSDDPDACATEFHDPSDDIKSGGVHSGSTILAYDNDNDNDMDLLIGDLTNRGLVYLENGGSAQKAFMTSVDTLFPFYDSHVDMSIFLSAFEVDVDQDGLNDLLVSPNEISSITNVNNIWYYRNTGNSNERFSLQQEDFLTEETLDFGSFSKPVFTDYNADGLMDILVGTDGDFGTSGPAVLAMYLFENRGTAENPEFFLVDDDYLDFSQFSSTSRNPAPAFGDLDGDLDTDLVIGDAAGFLYYFENVAGPDAPYEFKAPVYKFMNIDAGQTVSPAIADLNGDGLGDLIIGERNSNLFNDTLGNVNYFENQGSVGNPFFDSDV